MTNFTNEMIEKARVAKTAEELLALAKENNVEMTAAEAEAYFAQLNPKSGELDDDDLDNVAGGGCGGGNDGPKYYYGKYLDGMRVISGTRACASFRPTQDGYPVGCMGAFRGVIHFDSDRSWTITCSSCGRSFSASDVSPEEYCVKPD